MPTYEPHQNLKWKYINSSGQLIIISDISVQLGLNELVTVSASSVSKGACTITLTVISGVNNTPVTQEVYYTNIGANLNNESAVRTKISALQMVNVTAIVMKDSAPKGDVSNITSTGSTVVII